MRFVVALLVLLRRKPGSKQACMASRDTYEAPLVIHSGAELRWNELRNKYRREIRVWFPSIVGSVAVMTVLAVYLVQRYLVAYFEPFGLNPVQVGYSKNDIVLRVAPYGVAVIVSLVLLRLVAIFFWVLCALDPSLPREPAKPRRRRLTELKFYTLGGATLIVVVATILLFARLTDYVSHLGTKDARRVVVETHDYGYNSVSEALLGINTQIVYLKWIGPPEYDPFGPKGPIEAGKHVTNGRILAQSGESTYVFDLLACIVREVPTIDIEVFNEVENSRRTYNPPKLSQSDCKAPF